MASECLPPRTSAARVHAQPGRLHHGREHQLGGIELAVRQERGGGLEEKQELLVIYLGQHPLDQMVPQAVRVLDVEAGSHAHVPLLVGAPPNRLVRLVRRLRRRDLRHTVAVLHPHIVLRYAIAMVQRIGGHLQDEQLRLRSLVGVFSVRSFTGREPRLHSARHRGKQRRQTGSH
jgi:hypothetical protein